MRKRIGGLMNANSVFYYFLHNLYKQTNMEKYFSSSYNSGITSMSTLTSFNSLIATSPRNKPKQQVSGYREYQNKGISSKTFTFKKEPFKTPSFLVSTERLNFRSVQKSTGNVESARNTNTSWKPSNNLFFKKRGFISSKQISIGNEKELRESDSTKCQSPKANTNSQMKISDFKKLRLIGNGKYGSVYMVKHLHSGFIAALKIIRKIDIDCLPKDQKGKMINQIIREIKIQMYLNHPNLIKLYGYFSDDYNIYLLMELGCDGQLYDLMKKKNKLHEDSVSIITRQILEGVSYMHTSHVIHRDIKPENIVLIHGFAKICDFGWSVFNSKQMRSTLCGTPLYLSPEILKGDMYNQKIDTWAIGTLAYEMFTGENPFKIKRKEDLSRIVTESFVMGHGSYELRDFLNSVLKKDPLKRADSQKIKQHDFINKYRSIETSEEICALLYQRPLTVHRSYYK